MITDAMHGIGDAWDCNDVDVYQERRACEICLRLIYELRSELAERATESVHAEAKIREVETELSVVQASQDLLATGVLDYKFVPDEDDPDGEDAEVSGAAT